MKMSKNEELDYLLDIVHEADRWTDCSQYQGFFLEVWDRIHKLIGSKGVWPNGEAKETRPDNYKPLSYAQWVYRNRKDYAGRSEIEKRNAYTAYCNKLSADKMVDDWAKTGFGTHELREEEPKAEGPIGAIEDARDTLPTK